MTVLIKQVVNKNILGLHLIQFRFQYAFRNINPKRVLQSFFRMSKMDTCILSRCSRKHYQTPRRHKAHSGLVSWNYIKYYSTWPCLKPGLLAASSRVQPRMTSCKMGDSWWGQCGTLTVMSRCLDFYPDNNNYTIAPYQFSTTHLGVRQTWPNKTLPCQFLLL